MFRANNILRRVLGRFADQSSRFITNKIQLNGIGIHYEKVGTGNVVVGLLPGALGTARNDFDHQLEGLNKDQFTLISWDPPGYGLSRPPERDFNDFYRKDAKMFASLMQALGYEKYSILGWSDGGITGLIIAANYPKNVEKLISHAANSYFSLEDKRLLSAISDLDNWSVKMREALLRIYDEKTLRKLWSGIIDVWMNSNDVCVADLSKIVCPTLIIQGDKDALVSSEHIGFLASKIKNSEVHIFPNGKHNLHQKYVKEFNAIVEKFLLK
ncbi:valacyclovir hydrolase-like protein [Dinothrombium tinctorium]|uniref:Valacyclovir hydrolase-like protein n=1 Tax=Dinothrombium tinctorium TaxID=1965070 RepID=A0A3S3NVE7_9ACAR|nr:valacyclovir hydrolase-like protein [Dinothrombium tinctorium]RWS06789.1 valacyclovir hydrolase-like protein [Dinothrombium tinctorium]